MVPVNSRSPKRAGEILLIQLVLDFVETFEDELEMHFPVDESRVIAAAHIVDPRFLPKERHPKK